MIKKKYEVCFTDGELINIISNGYVMEDDWVYFKIKDSGRYTAVINKNEIRYIVFVENVVSK